jgi:hypothetical protein
MTAVGLNALLERLRLPLVMPLDSRNFAVITLAVDF